MVFTFERRDKSNWSASSLEMRCGANFEALPGPSFNSEMPSSSRYLVPCHHICSWYLHLSIFVGYIFVGSLEHTDSTVPGSIVCSCVSPLRPEVFLSRFKYRSPSWSCKEFLEQIQNWFTDLKVEGRKVCHTMLFKHTKVKWGNCGCDLASRLACKDFFEQIQN